MKNLDNKVNIKIFDKSDMYHKIIHLPEHIIQAYFQSKILKPKHLDTTKKFEKIVICGMGGSAISGDIIKSCYDKIIPIEVVKNYKVNHLDDKTLLIACSYSGNTEETLSIVKQAIDSKCEIAAVTSGGKLEELLSDKSLIIKLDKGFPPRSAVGFLFFSIIKILEIYSVIPNQKENVDSLVAQLVKKAGAISYNEPEESNIAKNSAKKINNKIPLVYAEQPELFPLAYRWKCQFNENAKYPAFCNYFPEFSHNEIEQWESDITQKTFIPIFIQRYSLDKRYTKHINAFKQLLSEKNIDYLEFFVEGKTLFEEIFSLIYLGDMISFYLAILQDTDPTPIKFINFIKEEFKKEEFK